MVEEKYNWLVKYHEDQILRSEESIRFLKDAISTLSRIRENYPNNIEIVESCREIMFNCVKEIKKDGNEIETSRVALTRLT